MLKAIHRFLKIITRTTHTFFQNTGQLRTDLWRRVLARIRHSNFFYVFCGVQTGHSNSGASMSANFVSSAIAQDDKCSGRPQTLLSSHTTENIEKVSAAVRKNRVQTIAESVEISSTHMSMDID
ncbi:hypothetical protein TNCV_4803101 [Trichonephila clavipes]|nr:hypothetical protein TNCV_4803101 [Trichonephila clavipes]